LAARRPRVAKQVPRKGPRKASKRAAPKPAPKKPPSKEPQRKRRARPERESDPWGITPDRGPLSDAEPEPVQESLLHIAQDAVIILRRELAEKARLATRNPGWMSMSDCIALLRLTSELGEAAKRKDGGQQADYSRLSPEERVQLAALLLKVDYA
jgi:hypothetical protein